MAKKIENCTLVIVDCFNYGKSATALKKSMEQNEFEQVIFFTDVDLVLDGIEIIKIPSIKSKEQYSKFIMKELWRYITTSFVLCIQHDGFTLNGDLFDERLYDYDYAGALWLNESGYENGNGGYSWRSKRLLHTLGTDDLIRATSPEDAQICRTYRDYLEKEHGLKWAPDEICEGFSFELRTPIKPTMGFHQYFHKPYQKVAVIRRLDAMGDAIMVEPILEYFHKKGYKVVFDTLPQFQSFFYHHHFPVCFPDQLDPRLLKTAEVYDLTMSYESKPKQLHLQSYYDFCGIKDGEIRNPKLSIGFDAKEKQYKPFPKYAIYHIDKRGQPGRNIEGINWDMITEFLIEKGYAVFLLGKGEHEIPKGVIQMNTVNESLLAYICAGADLFVGIDSGISNICSAFNVPSVIMFGAVNPEYIYPDLSNKIIITNHNKEEPICKSVYCWHSVIGCEGVSCYINPELPPCSVFKTEDIFDGIEKLINQ